MGGMINQTPQPLQMYQVPPTVTPFSQSPNYFGAYTVPMQIGAFSPTSAPQYDRRGKLIKGSDKSSFENPSALPLYSMYIPPSTMPNINAYLQSPASLLGAMQSANITPQGAGQYLTSNTSTGQ